MYQILQKFDKHWHDGGPSIAMMYHLRRVSDLLCNWKSCLLCYMKDVVLHCSIFFKWNKLVRVRVLKWGLINHCSSSQISTVCSDIFVLTSKVFSNGWLSHFFGFNGSEWYLAIVFYRVSKNINFCITAFHWYFCQDCIFVTHTDNQFHIVQYKYSLYRTFACVPS